MAEAVREVLPREILSVALDRNAGAEAFEGGEDGGTSVRKRFAVLRWHELGFHRSPVAAAYFHLKGGGGCEGPRIVGDSHMDGERRT